jgi:hypothetical protein
MDMLIGFIFVGIIGLAVAQFFIMGGAFKKGSAKASDGGASVHPAAQDGAGANKSRVHDGNSSDSSDSGSDGGGDGGGGGGP